MTVSGSRSLDPLRDALLRYQNQQWTGKVIIEGISKYRIQSQLFLSLGRFVWATGGMHPVRRWQRHLLRACGQLEPTTLALRRNEPQPSGCWDYEVLLILVRRGVIGGQVLDGLIQGVLTDVLFDLLQWGAMTQAQPESVRWSVRDHEGVRPSNTGILSHAPALDVMTQWAIAQQRWQQWQGAKLTRISPHLAPVITNAAELQARTQPKIYQNLSRLLTGQRTLRDVAWLMKQDDVAIARSLLPYVQSGAIAWQSIPDLPRPNLKPAPAESATEQPLVAYIDDSPQVRQVLDELLKRWGCRTLAIADPLQAVPQLVKSPPQIIFLDLVMPIVNGYELCAQLRRVAQFKDIPIVILTGQDGIVDRVRAKLVGATDFLSKPIVAAKLQEVLLQHGVAIVSSP